MKHGTENKLKFKKLQRRLGLSLWQCKGLLQTLWDFARDNAPAGDVGRFSDDELAIGIDWQGDPEDLISALVDERWLDRTDSPARLIIHGWAEHCEDTIHNKLARSTEFFADGAMPRLTRLSKHERPAIIDAYRKLTCADKRTANARRTLKNTQPDPAIPDPAIPDPAIPSHTKPCHTKPDAKPGAESQESGACADEISGTQENPAANGRRSSVFDSVTVATLKSPSRLDAWLKLAAAQKPKPVISGSEADRLRVHGAAVRAIDPTTKAKNAKALFVSIVTKGLWANITAKQEDRAHERIKELDAAARDGP